jgi:hypothetical protein
MLVSTEAVAAIVVAIVLYGAATPDFVSVTLRRTPVAEYANATVYTTSKTHELPLYVK